MRCSGPITDNDREEIRKFQDFLKRWNENKLGVLQDPDMQEYLNVTPQEAWLMMKNVSKKSHA